MRRAGGRTVQATTPLAVATALHAVHRAEEALRRAAPGPEADRAEIVALRARLTLSEAEREAWRALACRLIDGRHRGMWGRAKGTAVAREARASKRRRDDADLRAEVHRLKARGLSVRAIASRLKGRHVSAGRARIARLARRDG